MLIEPNIVIYKRHELIFLRSYFFYMDFHVFSVSSPTLCSTIGPFCFIQTILLFYPLTLCDIVGPCFPLQYLPVFLAIFSIYYLTLFLGGLGSDTSPCTRNGCMRYFCQGENDR